MEPSLLLLSNDRPGVAVSFSDDSTEDPVQVNFLQRFGEKRFGN
ncbi:MAG: hypothetical protein JWN42_846 [Candidatus Angelobacter sp.]|nr:hypothetical protein [Candidatus Angelobacter sp.]